MLWNDFCAAFRDAQRTISQADSMANEMADMVSQRLHLVSPSSLTLLKRRLRHFNTHTRKWDKEK